MLLGNIYQCIVRTIYGCIFMRVGSAIQHLVLMTQLHLSWFLIAQSCMNSSTNIKHGALMKICRLLINNNISRIHQSRFLKFNGSNHTSIQAKKQEKKALKYRKLQLLQNCTSHNFIFSLFSLKERTNSISCYERHAHE